MSRVMSDLMLTVDLELEVGKIAPAANERLDAATAGLIALCERHALPATWAVADPARSAATESIRESWLSHELAIVGDRTWVGMGAGRLRFSRELARRVGSARSAGLSVRSLVVRQPLVNDHLDLLVRHGISAVAPIGLTMPQSDGAANPLRYGVFELPVTTRLPIIAPWWQLAGSELELYHRLSMAVATGRTLHLAITASQILETGNDGLDMLDRCLGQIAMMRLEGKVRVETLSPHVDRHLARRLKPHPSRSILRPAA